MAHASSQTPDTQAQQAAMPFSDTFKKMADDQVARAASMFDELGKLEAASLEQAQSVIKELSRVAQESIAYSARLTAEWRRLTLDAAKSGSSFLKPRA